MLWALRTEGLTADQRDALTDRWWPPLDPTPDPDTTGPAVVGAGAAAADDEWAQEWTRRMGLTT